MTHRSQRTRASTGDRGPPGGFTVNDGIHTTEQIGPNRHKQANGNLICLNVPIARVGWMIYGPGETPIEVGSEGVAYVERTAETLFDPKTIGSFMGVAVVDEHPPEDVTPDNWKQLARGFSTTNVRRGEGEDGEVLLADLIVTDKDLIQSILEGKREVSCGYDADYTQTANGVGTQTNIIGNHIALVEKGRCGPRCAIGDQEYQPQRKEPHMATKRVKIVSSPQRRASLDAKTAAARQRVKDAEAELAELEGEGEGEPDGDEGGDTHIHLHVDTGNAHANSPMTEDEGEEGDEGQSGGAAAAKKAMGQDADPEERLAALESGLQETRDAITEIRDMLGKISGPGAGTSDADEDEGEEGDETTDEFPDDLKKDDEDKGKKAGDGKPGKTADSRALEAGYKQVMAMAEVLVPGFRMPTFDAKAKRAATIDKMCGARRSAMTACYATADGATLINSVAGSKTVDIAGMNCKDLATVFRAAAGAKALLNNSAATRDSKGAGSQQETAPPRVDLASINEANRKFWEGQLSR